MATFTQNIKNIRGEAIYGPDMRESIAEAITQAIDLDAAGDGLVFFNTMKISETSDDYILNIINQ